MLFVLPKYIGSVPVKVVNEERGKVGGVAGEAGVPGFDEDVVNLGRGGSDCVGHGAVRGWSACVGDLVGVFVFDGGVSLLGVSVFGEVIGAVLLFDELGGGFKSRSFVFVAFELSAKYEGVGVVVLGVGKAGGKGVVVSVGDVSSCYNGLYCVHVELADGVAFSLCGVRFVEDFELVEGLSDSIDLFADVVVFGVGVAVEGVGVLVIAFVVVFGYGGGADVRHASTSVLAVGGDVDVPEDGVLEGA